MKKMKEGPTSASAAPPQYLLSTIYRQSWHPVASTQRHASKNAEKRNDSLPIAGNLRCPSPFQSTVSPRKRSSSRTEHSKTFTTRKSNCVKEYRPVYQAPDFYNNDQQHNSATSPAKDNTWSDLCSDSKRSLENLKLQSPSSPALGTKQIQTPLSVWRRRLKTYVANSRAPGCDDSSSPNLPSTPINLAVRQHSWSNYSSAKGYRVLTYPNNTLARICLEGRSPPIQLRPESSRGSDRTRSISCSTFPESEIPEAEEKTETENEFLAADDNKSTESLQEIRYGNDLFDAVKAIAGESASKAANSQHSSPHDNSMNDSSSNDNHANSNSDEDDDFPCSLDHQQQNDLWRYKDNAARPSMEDLDNSDLSENEWCSDQGDDTSVMDHTETDMEKFKKMYENENRSSLKEFGAKDDLISAHKVHIPAVEEQQAAMAQDIENGPNYAFADVLPGELNEYNLRELSLLPTDINWRSVVDISRKTVNAKTKIQTRQQTSSLNLRNKRRPKTSESRDHNALESIIDRLLVLEKLQMMTVNQEVQRKYHNTHHRPSFIRSKSVSGKTSASTAEVAAAANETASNTPTESIGNRSVSRRRNSNPNANMRMAWATETTQGDSSVFKRACKDGDLTILHKHWINSCKNNVRKGNTTRRNSESANNDHQQTRFRNFRHRPGVSMYVYEWSERIKDDKSRYSSFALSQPKACPACRERARKLRRNSYSQHLSRPRTPRPVSRNNRCTTSEKPTSQQQQKTTASTASSSSKSTSLTTSVVSPLLWKQCKPINSNLHIANAAIKSAGKDYDYLTRPFQRSKREKPEQPSGEPHLLTSAVTISSVLFNSSVN